MGRWSNEINGRICERGPLHRSQQNLIPFLANNGMRMMIKFDDLRIVLSRDRNIQLLTLQRSLILQQKGGFFRILDIFTLHAIAASE